MKRVHAILVAVGLGLSMAGCKSDFVSTTVDKPAATDFGSSMAPTNPRPTEDATARVGQPVTIEGNDDGSKIQVTALKVVNTKPTDQLLTVDQGKRLLPSSSSWSTLAPLPMPMRPGMGPRLWTPRDSSTQQPSCSSTSVPDRCFRPR